MAEALRANIGWKSADQKFQVEGVAPTNQQPFSES